MISAMTRGWWILERGHDKILQKIRMMPAWVAAGSVLVCCVQSECATDLDNKKDYGIFGVIVDRIDFFENAALGRNRVCRGRSTC